MFDHVGIGVADFAASERFYRTVLSRLGAEPNHADAELVGDMTRRWIAPMAAPADPRSARRLPSAVPRGRGRLLAGGDRRGLPRRRRARAARDLRTGPPRRLPARPGRQQRGGGAHGARGPHARRARRPPLDPRPRSRRVQALLHDDRPARRVAGRRGRAGPRPDGRRGLQLLAGRRWAAAHGARPRRVHGAGRRDRSGVPHRRARRGLRGQRRSRRAPRLPPGYYGASSSTRGHNVEVVNHNR